MNRELKFRVWDKRSKEMVAVCDLTEGVPLFFAAIIHPYYNPDDRANYEIMQFTGLHDCDGKEIFEGDILLFKFLDNPPEEYPHTTSGGVVKWSDEYLAWWCGSQSLYKKNDFTKIIGNIFENYDLLEHQK